MTRVNKLQICNIMVYSLYIIMLVLNYFNVFIVAEFSQIWLGGFLLAMSSTLFCKAIIFKMDSSLWFAIFLCGCGVVVFLNQLLLINFKLLWPALFTSASFSSIVIVLIFKQILHLFVFFMLVFIQVPMYLYVLGVINNGLFVVSLIITIVATVIVAEIISKKVYFKCRSKNGKI